ncbi:small ribosomal subunit Rsm22 family protein [Desulfonatronum sp. SC1]|uniref:small ribosomal subunit Rsm22 family protein n=1 Tax=Desulfonatronum sp. SC1 TaxID=2109626 RepID=UPI000D31884B|nr:small ribosomal subunit Rsm22 family protein [Desulfonatronum sp. SC1]PTN37880.1 hypothetical protein C6366_04965 [Desulfonatronum sp. SC1]
MSDTPSRPAGTPGFSGAPFPDLSVAAQRALTDYADLLREVMPMKAAHRRRLPDNIQELSSFLIEDRAEFLGRDYLHAPAALGAYLWYFLPWNLLRLTRLLGGLDLDLPEGATIVDLGSGPLTVVQALALARPDLLTRELHFHCLDATPKPMREGRKLYHGLVNSLKSTLGQGQSRWKIHLIHAPWHVGLKDLPRADLLTAANFLNELPWHRRDPLGEQVADFFRTVAAHQRHGGRCLFVEPGNRLGGKLVSLVRESAVAEGWHVLGPCTHHQACPMLEYRETSWCHFTLSARGCPPWLTELSREADLAKRDVSLSYAYLVGPDLADPGRKELNVAPNLEAPYREAPAPNPPDAGKGLARIISAEFSVPTRERGQMIGRYGCAAQGKLLILSAPGAPGTRSGDLVPVRLSEPSWRDPKSHAVVAELPSTAGKAKSGTDKPKPKQGTMPKADVSDKPKLASSGESTGIDQKKDSRQRSSGPSAKVSKKRRTNS